ncbi:MAG: lipopolysaccharide biosynthesis protein [Sedimentisphaerales bacterium]|nr:lipopolysaccharide biosynthesis protein [Sedimentisphaerales bacterium]
MADSPIQPEEAAAPSQNDRDDFFDIEYLKKDLKGRSVRGGAVTVFAQAGNFVLRMGSIFILARILTPDDFGIVAMVMVLTNFALMLKDAGLSIATVQNPRIDHRQVSKLFWINVAIGLTIAAAICALAPAVAWFYGESRLVPITMSFGIVFVFSGLTIQHQALLRRHMRFFTVSVVEVSAMAASVVVAIIAGLLGSGYWALVIRYIAQAAALAAGMWIACPWRPQMPRRGVSVRKLLAFGGNVTGFNVVNYFARNADKLLIGRFIGSAVLGLYTKAYELLMLPISQIQTPLSLVAIPAFSRMQDRPDKFRKYYVELIMLVGFISMPLVVLLGVCSKEVVLLLLGDQWLAAAGIFQILAVASFIQVVWFTAGIVMVSLGQSGRFFRFGIGNSVAAIVSFSIGIRWGAQGVAAAYTAANYLILFPSLWYCFRLTPIRISAFVRAAARPAICSLIMAAAIAVVRQELLGSASILILGVCFLVGLAVYGLSWLCMPDGRGTLRNLYGYVQILIARRSGSLQTSA